MKKNEVQVGKVYAMKVSGDIVPVKITGEKWSGDKHTGWTGTNTKTNRGVRIKSAQRLRGEVGGAGGGGGKHESQDHEAPSAKDLANNAEVEKVAKGKKPAAAKAPKPAKEIKAPKAAKVVAPKAKRVSALDAAAQVLAASAAPMRATEMIAAMEATGLWKSPGGKTPEATLYAAIIREIAAKGDKARFRKHERGVFVPGKGV